MKQDGKKAADKFGSWVAGAASTVDVRKLPVDAKGRPTNHPSLASDEGSVDNPLAFDAENDAPIASEESTKAQEEARQIKQRSRDKRVEGMAADQREDSLRR
eukprot:SAG31_NODE_2620_length_5364_cov_27.556315_5_plen_102_part_00